MLVLRLLLRSFQLVLFVRSRRLPASFSLPLPSRERSLQKPSHAKGINFYLIIVVVVVVVELKSTD